MKVLSMLGSPRKKGNTAKVLTWAEEEFQNLGHQVDRVNVVDYQVNGCLGCQSCQRVQDEPGCAQKDDMSSIFDKVLTADVIIFASGLFTWGIPGQFKSLFDRFFCLIKGYGSPHYKSLIQGKKGMVIATCGGPVEGNADLLLEMYKRTSELAQMPPMSELVVPFCITPDSIGEETKMQVKDLVRGIAG